MLLLKNICLFIEIHFVVLFQVEITFPVFLIPGCNMQHKNDIILFFARDACILSGWSCLLQPAGGAALSQGRLGGGRHAGQNGQYRYLLPVLRIQIRIHVFLGLLDPDPDPLVRSMDPDPEAKIVRKTLISTVL